MITRLITSCLTLLYLLTIPATVASGRNFEGTYSMTSGTVNMDLMKYFAGE